MAKIFVSKAVAAERLAICNACPKKLALVCTECGCFVSAKARLSSAKCPINKWAAAAAELEEPWDVDILRAQQPTSPCCGATTKPKDYIEKQQGSTLP
jgi:hypothetical protein